MNDDDLHLKIKLKPKNIFFLSDSPPPPPQGKILNNEDARCLASTNERSTLTGLPPEILFRARLRNL
jgi:hypothetical protein